VGPAQIGFTSDGRALIVTEKGTDTIGVFRIGPGGMAGDGLFQPSEGMTPFGFGFGRDALIVSEAFGGAIGASAVSSYSIGPTGILQAISPSVPTEQTAACWIAVTRNERFAYTTNTGSGSVSGYFIRPNNGQLFPLTPGGVTGSTGMNTAPIDAATVGNHQLYVLSGVGNESRITTFFVGSLGNLYPVQHIDGLPRNANGLAAD
jgi:6-phosphogluconolactonase (cycloisomerase 2 family)